jgi:hypothetical protein
MHQMHPQVIQQKYQHQIKLDGIQKPPPMYYNSSIQNSKINQNSQPIQQQSIPPQILPVNQIPNPIVRPLIPEKPKEKEKSHVEIVR